MDPEQPRIPKVRAHLSEPEAEDRGDGDGGHDRKGGEANVRAQRSWRVAMPRQSVEQS